MFDWLGTALPETSTMAPRVETLFAFIELFSIVSGVIIVAGLGYFIWRYRRKGSDDKTPYIEGHRPTEIGVSLVLFVFVMVMFTWGYVDYYSMLRAPANSLEINVIGKQWLWEFQYANGKKTINELRVPLGQPVKLIMTSDDVLHSFYIPNFRIKQDLIPGQYTTLWFEATKAGHQIALCAEYCGTSHSNMHADVIVMQPQDFVDWLEGFTTAEALEGQEGLEAPGGHSLVEEGIELFRTKGCLACHSLGKEELVGPSMEGLFGRERQLQEGEAVRVDENYLRESMMEPLRKVVKGYPPVMPTYKGQLSEEELNALIALIKSLKKE